jgi:streptomycin 6-kinase
VITIPDGLRSKASTVEHGRQWLDELPAVCRRLSEEWSVDLGRSFAGCHISLVITADRGPQQCVLKVPLPLTIELGTLAAGTRAHEPDALQTWAGEGAARMIEYDETTGAMLIERCVPGLTLDLLEDPARADQIAAKILHRLHRPPTGQFDRVADRAIRLAQDLPGRFETARAPFDHWLLDTAVEFFTQLARSGPAEILLHGDFHHDNILSAQREPWLAVDPLPMVGDPAYDAVQYLLFRKGDLADPIADWGHVINEFCARLDVDTERVKAWTFARLVSDALASFADGMPLAELEAWQGDLWSARLVHRLRE